VHGYVKFTISIFQLNGDVR